MELYGSDLFLIDLSHYRYNGDSQSNQEKRPYRQACRDYLILRGDY